MPRENHITPLTVNIFCIINNKREIITYPKQRRLYTNQLKTTNYYKQEKRFIERILDKVNVFLMKPLKMLSINSIRILSTSELFQPDDTLKETNLTAAIYIQRGNYRNMMLSKTTSGQMAYICTNMMMAEMKNLTGLYDLLSCYGVVKQLPNQIDEMFEVMTRLYREIFNNAQSYLLHIPTHVDFDFIEEEIHPLLINIINESSVDIEI